MTGTNDSHKVIHVGQASQDVIICSHQRLLVVVMVFFLGFASVSFRVLEVAIIGGEDSHQSAQLLLEDPSFSRNDIVDREGHLLVSTLMTASLFADPRIIMDVDEAVDKLVGLMPELNRERLSKRLSSDRKFVWIKRNLTPVEQYQVNHLGLPGLFFKREEKRVYPHKNLASHVLGFVNVDGKGIAGIEKHYNDKLSEAGNNEPLELALDMRVQEIVHQLLSEQKEKYNAKGAVGGVMDVTNGEIVGLVSLPDFDPNSPGDYGAAEHFNRATLGVYEMGSTFKTFNNALAIEKGDMHSNDMFDVTDPIRASNFTIRDYHPKEGFMSLTEIFMYSSNIGSAKMAIDVGQEKQRSFLETLGLLSPLEIELPEVSQPLLPSKWGRIATMTISYGHGIAVSPVHVMQATAALVNGGVYYPATLLKTNDDDMKIGRRVISEQNSDLIRKYLRLAVKYGTGSRAEVDRYVVGGKTGSADKVSNGRYQGSQTLSSFIGVFPMQKPKYTVFAMFDEPKSKGFVTGGVVAAPVVGDIIEKIGPVLLVPPISDTDDSLQQEFYYEPQDDEAEVAAYQPL